MNTQPDPIDFANGASYQFISILIAQVGTETASVALLGMLAQRMCEAGKQQAFNQLLGSMIEGLPEIAASIDSRRSNTQAGGSVQ